MQALFVFVSCLTQMTVTLWPLLTSLSVSSVHPFSTRQFSSISLFYLLLRPGSSRQCGSIPAGTGGDGSIALKRLPEEQTSLYACTPPLSLSIHPRLPPQGQEIIHPTVLLHGVIAGLFFSEMVVKLGGIFFYALILIEIILRASTI